ncbi:hypothetical protein MKZ38_004668 [Zalerion maritima]|uniref:Uncharacterized protein n=1 Tax=Zalerion maritima TaxID=339359 RepID=A0AAD5WPR0_9PEZI|nr:hypothetical protein MKZ38_004668 [Zalerion maritima]
MVHASVFVLAAISAFTGLAAADWCTNGLDYCGYNLLNKGNYYQDIVDELGANGKSTAPDWISNSLFACHGESGIDFISKCSGCRDGGSGESDFC